MKKLTFSLVICLLLWQNTAAQTESKPKLILQITVDQLRSDLPMTVYDRLPGGGFKYLYEQGINYVNAHHGHAITETVVGHATLATGADPSAHGMISNLWYDEELKRTVYNVEDARYPLIGENAGIDKATEIDPTQAAAGTDGRSPAAIKASTFSDELAAFTNGEAKIFGVSVKDRGAITLAGHAGKAFWFSKSNGKFVTSTYYYDQYPAWVAAWNKQAKYLDYANTKWELMHDISTYTHGNEDDMAYETSFPGYGIVFPHEFGSKDNPYFSTFLTLSPVGDELTLDFTKELVQNEELGADAVTDYLSVSFSSTDYVGHIFGPSSLESEDNLFRLDRTLASLFQFIDEQVGLENTLIVLSADHGGPEVPERLKKMGIDAGYFDKGSVDAISVAKKFGASEKLIAGFYPPYIHLNKAAIEKHNLDENKVARAVAAEIRKLPGIAYAIPSIDLLEGKYSKNKLNQAVLRNYYPKRSGAVFIVTNPNWYMNDFDGLSVASVHGSPWNYDTHVPILFAGNGLKPIEVFRKVETIDVALTLANYLKIRQPSGATGRPLEEVLKK